MKAKWVLAALAMCFLAAPVYADVAFVNGGFENGDLNGWTVDAYTPPGGNALPPSGGSKTWSGNAGVNKIAVTNGTWGTNGNVIAQVNAPGPDPNVKINKTYNGKYAAQVGDDRYWGYSSPNAYQYSQISQSAKVTGTSAGHIYFAWAAILETSNHSYYDTPFFQVVLEDTTTGNTIYDYKKYEKDGTFWTTAGSYQHSTGNNPSFPGWIIEDLDLTGKANVGDDILLKAITRDCNPTGHAMYVYLDGFGAAPPPPPGPVPEPGTMMLLGSGLVGLVGYGKRKFRG